MKENKETRIVAVIPAYNEERTIASVILSAEKYVDRVIVCDDGSTDMTGVIARRLGAELVRHESKHGYGAALQSLFKRARAFDADVMVTLDGDGQHDPNEIPMLVELVLERKADVVIGSRFLGDIEKMNDIPRYRRYGIMVITKLTKVASKSRISDAQSGFRAYGRKALKSLRLHENGMGASVEVLMEAKTKGLTVVEVPTGCNYHGLKTSTHNALGHAANVVMSIAKLVVEERPLVFLGIPGVMSLLVGIFFGVWMLRLYAIEQQIITNVALASISFILIGLFAISTAITLYSIIRLMEKITKQ